MNQLRGGIDLLGRAEAFTYDGTSNLANATDRKAETASFAYEALNRRTRATYADGVVATFTYVVGRHPVVSDSTATRTGQSRSRTRPGTDWWPKSPHWGP